jgi:hypothetical protein
MSPVGGLLGMLLRGLMQQGQIQPGTDSVSTPNGAPEYNSNSFGSPQGGLLALQDEQTRNASDAFGSYDPSATRVDGAYATPPQEFPSAPQKTVRLVSRRVVR